MRKCITPILMLISIFYLSKNALAQPKLFIMKIQKKYTSYLEYLLTALFFLQSFSVFCQRNPLTLEGFHRNSHHFDDLTWVSKIIDGQEKYGFVDKDGNLVFDCMYDRVVSTGPLSVSGYRKVIIDDVSFLLYPNGDSYRFIDDYCDIDENITALSLGTRDKKPYEVDDEVFEHTQIRALTLYNVSANSLKKLKNFDRIEHLKVYFRGQDIPVEIFDLVHLKSLMIIAHNAKTIPPEIGKLENLERFRFVTKRSLSVPSEIGNLKKIKVLYLDGSSDYRYRPLPPLPKEVTQLEQLEQLTIDYPSDNLIPEGLGKLARLKHLSIHIDTTLSPSLGELKNLESLNLLIRERDNLNMEALKKLTNLKSLSVSGSGNFLSTITRDLKKLKYLYINRYSSRRNTDDFAWVGALEQLEELALQYRSGLDFSKLKNLKYLLIEGITDSTKLNGLEELTQLEAFIINPSRGYLKTIPVEVKHLTNLRYLDCNLELESGATLPNNIEPLLKLKHLEFNHQLITISKVPKGFNRLKNVGKVKLKADSYNQLKSDLNALKHIRKLVIEAPSVTELPINIGKLTNLELLMISMPIYTLPKEIKNLKNLKELGIYGYEYFTEEVETLVIPPTIGQLDKLEKLYLHGVNIKQLPAQIGKLQNLKTLSLHENEITEIPPTIEGLKNLEELQLMDNLIEELPSQIGELSQLRKIYMKNNKLKKISKNIGNLTKLEYLGLNHNNLNQLPKEIGNLINLKTLLINDNNIKEIPETIGKLEKLRNLSLGNNDIEQLPPILNQLPCLNVSNYRSR